MDTLIKHQIGNLKIEELKSGIMYHHLSEATVVDDMLVSSEIEFYHSLSRDGKKIKIVFDITNMMSLTKEARVLYASEDVANYCEAYALISNSVMSTFIVNFFRKLYKTDYQYRMFSTQEEALDWLSTV